jgi:hypothetical protein
MARSIENIVESHRIAAHRRKVGLPSWARTINIKPIIKQDPDNTSNEHAASVANRVAGLLRQALPAHWLDWQSNDQDEDITILVEELEALKPDSYDDDPDFTPLEDLNNMLDRLYDWANIKRIWLGA